MIQRVQSIWLLLASAAVLLTLKLPTLVTGDLYQTYDASHNFFLMVITSALGMALLINIFLFKHRTVQFRICIISILVECLIIFLYAYHLKDPIKGTFNIWAILHVIILITLFMAARGIYKDEKLIKESSRLR